MKIEVLHGEKADEKYSLLLNTNTEFVRFWGTDAQWIIGLVFIDGENSPRLAIKHRDDKELVIIER
ncbi:hypothetical protein [Allochromatium vinosum]|uniref:hypothetical protein n=1 Tax=Allochromatium vinosum TaxID=1049 RepID=UPI0001A78F9B|nr:hypothetical protein [Allochromatium vinosum]